MQNVRKRLYQREFKPTGFHGAGAVKRLHVNNKGAFQHCYIPRRMCAFGSSHESPTNPWLCNVYKSACNVGDLLWSGVGTAMPAYNKCGSADSCQGSSGTWTRPPLAAISTDTDSVEPKTRLLASSNRPLLANRYRPNFTQQTSRSCWGTMFGGQLVAHLIVSHHQNSRGVRIDAPSKWPSQEGGNVKCNTLQMFIADWRALGAAMAGRGSGKGGRRGGGGLSVHERIDAAHSLEVMCGPDDTWCPSVNLRLCSPMLTFGRAHGECG